MSGWTNLMVDTEEDIQPAPGRKANPWFSVIDRETFQLNVDLACILYLIVLTSLFRQPNDISCLHLRLIEIFQNILV
jgi:hypothetical protein